MKHKAIFFDVDGVLIDSPYLFTDRLKEQHGIELEVTQPFFTGRFRLCTVGQADLKEELEAVITDWGWKGTIDELMDFWFNEGSKINQEVLDYVISLHKQGIRCFIATDQEKYRGEWLKKQLKDADSVEDFFFSAEIGAVKKTEPFWEAVLERLNKDADKPLTRSDLLFIDDDQHKVDAVNSFGIESWIFTSLDDIKEKLT